MEGLSGVGYLSVFHPPPLISQEPPVVHHIETMKPPQGKTTKNKTWILPQQQCEVFMEIRFFSFPKSEKQGWKWEASKGLQAHLLPKKTSLNSPINDNLWLQLGGGERIFSLHKIFFWSLFFLGENGAFWGQISTTTSNLILGWGCWGQL